MKIEEHYHSAKNLLDQGMIKLNTDQDESAIDCFVAASSAVSKLLDHAWRLKCKAALEAKPPEGS